MGPVAGNGEDLSGEAGYEPPSVRRLGTVADLTRAGGTGIGDGAGLSGASGSLP